MLDIPIFLNLITTQFTVETFKEFMTDLYINVEDLGDNKIKVADQVVYHTFKLEEGDFTGMTEDYTTVSIDGVPLNGPELVSLASLIATMRVVDDEMPSQKSSNPFTLISGGKDDDEEE